MLTAFTIRDAPWNTLGGIVCSLFAAVIVVYLTQKLIEKRERRNRRNDLRLDLYRDIVALVLDDERGLAERGSDGQIPPVELQTKRIRVFHLLKLLGSQAVRDAYDKYRKLVFQETEYSLEYRPKDPDEVVRARDELIEAMAKEVQGQKI